MWHVHAALQMAELNDNGMIHFDPYISRVETGFWHELAQRKLEKYKLSEAEQDIRGCYSNGKCHGVSYS